MNEKIYKRALNHYGSKSQEDKLIEEMAELTQAILKHRRKRTATTLEHLHDEFADVQIVMEQFKLMLDKEKLESHREDKLIYLESLINQGINDPNKY